MVSQYGTEKRNICGDMFYCVHSGVFRDWLKVIDLKTVLQNLDRKKRL